MAGLARVAPAGALDDAGDLARPEAVFQLCHPALPIGFPLLRSLGNPDLPNNLPMQLTSFIGRQRELIEVKDLLARTRLLTLTGSGGCGKTRLALQAAADTLDDYPDGVWLVELAALSDPALVPQSMASVLGVKEEAGRSLTEALVGFLRPRMCAASSASHRACRQQRRRTGDPPPSSSGARSAEARAPRRAPGRTTYS